MHDVMRTGAKGLLRTRISFLIALVALPLVPVAHAENTDRDAIQVRLDAMDIRNLTLQNLESAFGRDYVEIVDVGVYEGYRDGELGALCSAEELANEPTDRTMALGSLRTLHTYQFQRIGVTVVALDDPWTVWTLELTDQEGFSLHGIRPGTPKTEIALPEKTPRHVSRCSLEWEALRITTSCAEVPEKERVVEAVTLLNQDLPTGCWFSFRGVYE